MERENAVPGTAPAGSENGSVFHLLVAVMIMATSVAIALMLVSTRHYLIPIALMLIQHGWINDRTTMDTVLTLGVLAPMPLLVGLLCGRRYRWVPAVPIALWLIYCWGNSLKFRHLFPADDLRTEVRAAVIWPVVAGLVFYLLALAGARLTRAGAVRVVLALLLGLGYVWLGVLALSLATMDTFELLTFTTTGAALLTVLLLAAYSERRIARNTVRFLLGLLCGASVYLDLVVVGTMGGLLTKDVPALAAAVAALVMTIILIALLVHYRGAATPGEAPAGG